MESVMSLRRALLCLVTLLLIKVCEYLLIEPRLEDLAEQQRLQMKSPALSHPRCDGCRAVAGMFDTLFQEEDSKIEHLGLELGLPEVLDIVNSVCQRNVFRKVKLVMKDGHRRLSFPNLETWDLSDLPSLEEGGVDWPQRMATHCRYMADMMPGLEIYDLWLRTGHGDRDGWLDFMCEGEGVFGDCNEVQGPHHWPGEHCYNNKNCHNSVTLNKENKQ